MLVPLSSLVLAAALSLADVPAPALADGPAPVLAREGSFVADAADNICGLSDLRALSDPAKVDYPHLWDATPEIKKLKRDGVDPDSAEGISLQQKATDRIREACDDVREADGNCSVWKKISHEDGRKIADITKKVERKFPDELDG